MSKFGWLHGIALLVLLVVVPVAVKQLTPQERRQLEGVSLDKTIRIEIDFRNETQQLRLGGLLFIPPGDGPFPAVVIIHGSGASSRENRWYLTLTHYLQQNGVAVLLPDKRGSEKSEGDWRTADFHDLATDTLAAIEFLGNQEHFAAAQIGVIGMSQGGWIAPIVANESDAVEFIVSVVGSAVTPVEQLRYEENHNLRQMGFLPGISNVIAAISTRIIRHFVQKDIWDGVAAFDPIPYWRELSVEGFALFGADDTNVPSQESAARLNEVNNPRIRTRIYSGSGHPLEDPPGRGNSIFRDDALDDIRDFISSIGAAAS